MENQEKEIKKVSSVVVLQSASDAPQVDEDANKSNERAGSKKPVRFQKRKKFSRRRKDDGFSETVVKINRVTKVTKGGRRFRFSALVVVGDKKGRIGFATGKANEVPDAIKKAIKEAKNSLVTLTINKNQTISHEAIGTFGAGRILMKPAPAGTGVIAGGPVRIVLELSGIKNIYAKSLGTNTPINMVRATFDGLKQIRDIKQVAELRDKTVAEILGQGE